MLIGKQSIGSHHINDNSISKGHPKEDPKVDTMDYHMNDTMEHPKSTTRRSGGHRYCR